METASSAPQAMLDAMREKSRRRDSRLSSGRLSSSEMRLFFTNAPKRNPENQRRLLAVAPVKSARYTWWGLEVAPYREQVFDGLAEIVGVDGERACVHGAGRSAADDREGIDLRIGKDLLDGGRAPRPGMRRARRPRPERCPLSARPPIPWISSRTAPALRRAAAVLPFSLRTGVPAARAFCNISAAWRLVASVILRPPSMRATSPTRSSSARNSTVAYVPRDPACLATLSCWRAWTATCARCVTLRTWWWRESDWSRLAHDLGYAAADTGIDLVEDERGHRGLAREQHLDGERQARELAARSHARERAERLALRGPRPGARRIPGRPPRAPEAPRGPLRGDRPPSRDPASCA